MLLYQMCYYFIVGGHRSQKFNERRTSKRVLTITFSVNWERLSLPYLKYRTYLLKPEECQGFSLLTQIHNTEGDPKGHGERRPGTGRAR